MSEVLVGRQPIFDRQLGVHGYELLFRGEPIDPGDPVAGDRATSRVIVSAFTEIGLDTLVSGKKAFLNLTRSFLTGENALPAHPRHVVLEVLETVRPDPDVLQGIERLKQRGFTIALDDFVFAPGLEPLLELADLVKLDVLGLTDAEILPRVERLAPFDVRLLAEKIETRDQYESCRRMGFTYFQGFFLERPTLVSGRSIHPQQLTLLSLLRELHTEAFDFQRAEAIVQQDVGLCYRLLRHINSALYGMPRKISSVREALVYLGLESVKNLASLFILASNEHAPDELISLAMVRARMCQNLGREADDPAYQQYFVVGLFSTLEALMETPMGDLLDKLPLSPPQKAALATGAGPMGEALRAVLAYEHGDWDNVAHAGLTTGRIKDLYVEALRWTNAVSGSESRAA